MAENTQALTEEEMANLEFYRNSVSNMMDGLSEQDARKIYLFVKYFTEATPEKE